MQRSKHNNKPFNKYNNAAVLQVFHEYTCMACSPLTISPKTITGPSFLLVGGGIRDEEVRKDDKQPYVHLASVSAQEAGVDRLPLRPRTLILSLSQNADKGAYNPRHT
jgi:hypothetical protein